MASAAPPDGPVFSCRVTTLRALRRPVAPTLLRALRRKLPDCRFDADAIETVLHEVIANAAIHGNLGLAGSADGGLESLDTLWQQIDARLGQAALAARVIEVDVALHPGYLTVTVRDEGAGFKVDAVAAPDQMRPHGRGIHLMRHLARSVTYCQGGRAVCLAFDVQGADAAS